MNYLSHFHRFIDLAREFGLPLAYYSMLHSRLTGYSNFSAKHHTIKSYLKRHYHQVYEHRETLPDETADSSNCKPPLWIYWHQGESAMPELIRICFHSAKRHASEYDVHLVTQNNISQYVDIPSYIYKKQNEGSISLTHFSDILRAALLSKYGGLWLDASIFVSTDIPGRLCNNFFSAKQKVNSNFFVSECRWAGYLMGGSRRTSLFPLLRDFFYAYWLQEKLQINYYLIDYCIAVLYDEVDEARKEIDNVPLNNAGLGDLCTQLNQPFTEGILQKIFAEAMFHKLTWKTDFQKERNSSQTVYGWLCKENLP